MLLHKAKVSIHNIDIAWKVFTIHTNGDCMLYIICTAMSCQYQYDIQPGPTSEICPLEGHSETALILQCRVSSSESGTNFSIVWHHSKSIPDRSNIFDHELLLQTHQPLSCINTTTSTSLQNTQPSLTSQLTLKGFDEKGTGYYWCSVVNSSSNVHMQNPSVILHIVHNIHCKANNEQPCNGDISLYKSSSSRCADQAMSIETFEAQNCLNSTTQEDQKQISTSFPTNPNSDHTTSNQHGIAPITTTLHVTNSQPTPQENASPSAPKFQLSMGVIIGASMGGFVLILFIIIGFLLVCVVKMKRKHQIREHRLDAPTLPFDDIRMYSSIAKLTQEKVDDPNRISKLYCESNTAYECLPTVASSQTENIYEYIN